MLSPRKKQYPYERPQDFFLMTCKVLREGKLKTQTIYKDYYKMHRDMNNASFI